MVGAIVILVITGIVVGIVATLGLGLFALILLPVGLAAAGWMALSAGSGRTAGDVAREAPRPEFLGPGGPDDPDRT